MTGPSDDRGLLRACAFAGACALVVVALVAWRRVTGLEGDVITTHCQRWRDKRGTYRVPNEVIQTRDYAVAEIPTDNEAKAFVMQHHYSGTYPAARMRAGLYRRGGELVGVAVLSTPASQAALDKALPVGGDGRADLGRLVLLDDVPSNAESWFLARMFELARAQGFVAVSADSDPAKRCDAAGRVVFAGHIGTVYQATNARYTGRSNRHTVRLFLDDHTVFSNAAWGKLRARKRGWNYVAEKLCRHGASKPPAFSVGDSTWRAWVSSAVEATTRGVRHPGNHRYVWALDKRLWSEMPHGMPYPKLEVPRGELAA